MPIGSDTSSSGSPAPVTPLTVPIRKFAYLKKPEQEQVEHDRQGQHPAGMAAAPLFVFQPQAEP